MQPNGQMPPIQPQQNPYDYILNPAAPPKKSFIFGSGKPNLLVKVLFVLGVLVFLMIAFTVYSNLTSKNYDSVVALAERQEEIVRISDIGLTKAKDPATLIYISTVRNTTLSEQNATLAFLKKKNVKVSTKQLALKIDTSTDKALTTAEQNNTYDTVLLTKIKDELTAYQKAEKQVTGTSDSTSEKTLFASLLSNAKVLNVTD